MTKFDIYQYFREALNEAEPAADPAQAQQPSDAQSQPTEEQPEQTPDQMAKAVNPVKTPFDEFIGSTIKTIQFKPHQNGGAIEIITSKSPVPLVISWAGDRVTAKYKDVVALK
jgi:biotin carboxyl carrier protein